MNQCSITQDGDHKLFEIKKLSQYVSGSPSYRTAKEGVLVVCAMCGEIREAWETGEIVIRPKTKIQHDPPNSTLGAMA